MPEQSLSETRLPAFRSALEVLLALVAFKREAGDAAGAERHLRKLAAINPGDAALAVRKPELSR